MRSIGQPGGQIEAVRRSVALIAPLSKMLGPAVESAMLPDVPTRTRLSTPTPISEKSRSEVVQAVHTLQGVAGDLGRDVPLVAGFDEDVGADRGRGFLGPRIVNHGLAAYFPELLRSLEPHFTKRFAHFLSPASVGAAGLERTRAFITALFEAANKPFPAELLPDAGANLSAEAEAGAVGDDRKRRIDLLIRWTDKQRDPHCLVAEAKFHAPVRLDALRAYSAFAMQTAGVSERSHLFLVLTKQRPLVLHDVAWQQVTWFSVLRHWERYLASMPSDEDFLLFRSALWRRA